MRGILPMKKMDEFGGGGDQKSENFSLFLANPSLRSHVNRIFCQILLKFGKIGGNSANWSYTMLKNHQKIFFGGHILAVLWLLENGEGWVLIQRMLMWPSLCMKNNFSKIRFSGPLQPNVHFCKNHYHVTVRNQWGIWF